MKKTLSIILSITMIFSVIASANISAYAVGNNEYEATPIATDGSWVEGELIESQENYYYRVDVPSDSRVTIKFLSYTCCKFNNEYYYGSTDNPSAKTTIKYCSTGSYCYNVENYIHKNSGRYRISILIEPCYNNETEPNDYDNAMVLNSGQMITGVLTEQDKIDWFKFSLSSKTTVNISLNAFGSIQALYLYKSEMLNEVDHFYCGGSEQTPSIYKKQYNLDAGTYYVKIDAGYSYQGKYTFKWENAIKKPGKVSLNKVSSPKKKQLKASWTKLSGNGYQMQYSTDKNFKKSVKSSTISKNSTTSKTISKLTSNKKYYVRVRAFKTVNGQKYYGPWSSTKSVKVK